MKPNLNRVILSLPSLVSLAATDDTAAPRSWIQLARTGSFTSSRYGKFAITKDDLSQMLSNFNNITPKAPTELPIDYDHLSMDPKKPGDGIAAGWMKRLELREDGTELWGEIAWTPDAAKRIEAKEYRFVSPSFVKEYTHKDGRKIGTTLLAAAITNHPFLESMHALTLYSFGAMGDLALVDAPATATEETTMQDTKTTETDIEQKAAAFLRRLPKDYTTADVLSLSRQYPDEGEAYRLAGIGATEVEAVAVPTSINLSVREGDTFDALAMRYAHEHGVSLRQAVHEVGKARPDLAEARG